MGDLVILQNRGRVDVQASHDLMKAKGLQIKKTPAEWEDLENAAEGFSAALASLDAQAGRPPEAGIAATKRLLQRRSDSGQAQGSHGSRKQA